LSSFLQKKNAKDHDALPATYLFHILLLNIINQSSNDNAS